MRRCADRDAGRAGGGEPVRLAGVVHAEASRREDPHPSSAIAGERKAVIVMFADVSGFTAMSEKLDPEEVHAIMDRAPNASANLNGGPGGCTDAARTALAGFNDWANLVYRASTALDFAGGVRSDTPQELTREQEEELFLAGDLEVNDIADARDCGAFLCTHRIDIKPTVPLPKVIKLGQEANFTIAIFSETSGGLTWNAGTQVQTTASLNFRVGALVFPVKTNHNGEGTCSISDVEEPVSGLKDGIRDMKCQFPTFGMPLGTHEGILSGFLLQEGQLRAFRARQVHRPALATRRGANRRVGPPSGSRLESSLLRRDARVAEGGALLRRYTGLNPYRGFESLSLRQNSPKPLKKKHKS